MFSKIQKSLPAFVSLIIVSVIIVQVLLSGTAFDVRVPKRSHLKNSDRMHLVTSNWNGTFISSGLLNVRYLWIIER